MGLDFGSKRYVERYVDSPKGRTVYIGRNGRRNETSIYDKRKQSKSVKGETPLTHDCTRIEINSLVKKRMRVRDLPSLSGHKPFRHMTRNEVIFHEPTTKSPVAWQRFGAFKSLTEREGLAMARRTLDKKSGRNFNSQFGDFYELKRINPSLDSIFQSGMAEFFKQ